MSTWTSALLSVRHLEPHGKYDMKPWVPKMLQQITVTYEMFRQFCATMVKCGNLLFGVSVASRPEGPKVWKILKIALRIENFKRYWTCQASHPPRPYVFWGRSRFKFSIEIEIFKQDWTCQARLNLSMFGCLGLKSRRTLCGKTNAVLNFLNGNETFLFASLYANGSPALPDSLLLSASMLHFTGTRCLV